MSLYNAQILYKEQQFSEQRMKSLFHILVDYVGIIHSKLCIIWCVFAS
jgi:hypothetical protein